jgi:peptidoglycan/LPS O-acetylase OafA/YrhL
MPSSPPDTVQMRAVRFHPTNSHAGMAHECEEPAASPGPSENPIVPRLRLAPIEGLRAYLALWVLVCHVLWSSGYEADALWIVPKLLAKGRYAVEVFIIVSGFVIFFLLDRQRENYKQFITRRIFRIFPLFVVLFLLAIPASQLVLWNTVHSPHLTPEHVGDLLRQIHSWWANIGWHVPLHLLMLHGAVPPVLLPDSSMAFLAPAWSLSTEWQFYLIAPLTFALAAGSRPIHRVGLCAACVAIFVAAKGLARVMPESDSNAALPSLLEFFFIGAASYFLYKRQAEKPLFDSAFPVFASLGVFLFVLGGTSRFQLIPVVIWIIFLGLILEHPGSWSARKISPLFTHPWAQYLGRISYSLYLSHMLLMSAAQYFILRLAPGLTQPAHFVLLLAATALLSIPVSAALYHYIEAPATELGRRLARKLGPDASLSRFIWPAAARGVLRNPSA